jgi:hypothetical protein
MVIQWTSNGQDQLKPPQRVTWVSEDGGHLRIHGSTTGIPMNEVMVVAAPAPTPLAGLAADVKADQLGDEKYPISVLLTPQGRLEISADVDEKGLVKLKEMLEHYEKILKLIG